MTPPNKAGIIGTNVVLPCKSSDGGLLSWAVSSDRGDTWTNIAFGDDVVGNNPHYDIISTEAGEYNLQILNLTLEDGALYQCQHLIMSKYAYANLVVMCMYNIAVNSFLLRCLQ